MRVTLFVRWLLLAVCCLLLVACRSSFVVRGLPFVVYCSLCSVCCVFDVCCLLVCCVWCLLVVDRLC